MTQPGVAGDWLVKDIIAHITWYEREMVGMIQARALVGSELWELTQDQRNVSIYEENRDRSLNDVLLEAEQVYEQLLKGLESLLDEDLINPSQFREMPSEWIPWKVLASNCFEHYHQHIPDIQAWLENEFE